MRRYLKQVWCAIFHQRYWYYFLETLETEYAFISPKRCQICFLYYVEYKWRD